MTNKAWIQIDPIFFFFPLIFILPLLEVTEENSVILFQKGFYTKLTLYI